MASADQRNQNRASGAICLPIAGFSSAGIDGMTRIWTKLKYHSRPIHRMPATTWVQRNTACQKIRSKPPGAMLPKA